MPAKTVKLELEKPTQSAEEVFAEAQKGVNFSLKLDDFKTRIIPYTQTHATEGPGKGEKATVSFTINPEVVRWMGQIIGWHMGGDTNIPYKTVADIARDACFKWTALLWEYYQPKDRKTLRDMDVARRIAKDWMEGEKLLTHDRGFDVMLRQCRIFAEDQDWEAILEKLAVWVQYAESVESADKGWYRHFVKTLARSPEIVRFTGLLKANGYDKTHAVVTLENWIAEWGKR